MNDARHGVNERGNKMLMARKQLKNWFLAPYPNRDLDTHIHICVSIQQAVRERLLSDQDVYYLLRYLAGYGDRAQEITIIRALTVIATLAELETNEQCAKRLLRGSTEQEIQTKVAEMNATDIWKEHESNYF